MRPEEGKLQEELEQGESMDEEEALELLPPELQEKWAEVPVDQLRDVIRKRKEALDKWLEKEEKRRREHEVSL